MKKIYLTILVTILMNGITSITVAGNYFPTGMTWKEVLCEPDYAPLDTANSFLYEVGEDTIVRGITCKKVLLNKTPLNQWIHEEGSKVWLLTDDYPEPIMIYDFDWHGDISVYSEFLTGESTLIKECNYLDVNNIQDIWLNGKKMEFIMNDNGSIIKDIGRVSELYRGCCMLGYKIEEPILPGTIYSKVLWIVRDGDEIFRSESAEEWITTIPEDEYMPLLREGVKWVYIETQYGYNHNGVDFDYSRFYNIEMKGDTTIDGTTYKKCYRYSGVDWSNTGYIICSNTKPIALLREEGRVLYAYNYDNFYFRVGQTMYDYPFWYTDDDSWYANDGKDVKLYEFNENEYFKFEGYMPFLNQNSEIFSYNANFYDVNDGVFIEGIGFDSYNHGDLLTPFYESSYCTCIFRSETGLHHVEDGDGNIIYYGKAFNRVLWGDVDCNRIVDIEDLNAVINIILKLKTQADYPCSADITNDNAIDVEDVNALINIILKLE